MDRILQEYSTIHTPTFRLSPITLTSQAEKLLIEFHINEKDGNIVLDPLLDGLRSPAHKVNRLIASIQRASEV